MCGRIALYTPPQRLARLLDAALAAGVEPKGEPSWNVAPTDTLFGVADRGEGRVLAPYRWGLVPWFAKDPTGGAKMINARAETLTAKPAFREAFERRRLLVPVDGFYEWDRRPATRVPHYFTRADGAPMVLAGLYERWRDRTQPKDAPPLTTCTVVTTTPNADLGGIHDRMPCVLEPSTFDLWLTGGADELEALRDLLAPPKDGTLVHRVVNRTVGDVRNNGPELIEPAAPTPTQDELPLSPRR